MFCTLKRVADQKIFPGGSFPNNVAAVAYFAKEIGQALSLDDNGTVADFMLASHEASIAWPDFSIPVYTSYSG